MTKNDAGCFPDFVAFGRTFEKYKWYKPLLIIILGLIFYFVFQTILTLVFNIIYGQDVLNSIMSAGYETMDSSDASVYYSYLSVAIFIPSIYMASKIVGDRPFSSYSSSRGGWNWNIYFKSMTIPLIIYVVYYAISLILDPTTVDGSQVSLIAVIIATFLIPVQCIAEEYVFRGVLLQSFGSWFKIPILAVILQAIAFAIGHTYDILGVTAVLVSGIVFGILSWQTNGLEAGSAIHSINNLLLFYCVTLGLTTTSSTLTMWDFVSDIAITLITGFAVYYIGTKKEWFSEKTPKLF